MKRKLSLLLPFFVVLSLLPTLDSSASGGRSRPRVVSHKVTESASEVAAYWTKDRMRHAKPAPVRLPNLNVSRDPVARGETTFVAPSSPEEAIALTRSRTKASSPKQGNIPDPDFTRDEIDNVTDFPYVTHGKLFFKSGGGNYVCSATVISSPNENTVVTAGHCIYDAQEGYSTKVNFVPGYQDGDQPFGQWTATEIFTTEQWIEDGDNRYDFAAFTTGPNANGDVEEAVGARGIIFNQQALGLEWEIFGYPAADPFDGESLWRCTTGPNFNDFINDIDDIIGVGCDLTGGSSGGGWMIDVGGTKFLNSVMSYGYDEPFLEYSFGPYLGSDAEAVFAEATGGEVPSPDPDPDPTEPPDDEGGEHELDLSLKLKNHLKVSGLLLSFDDFIGCYDTVPVDIYKMINRTTGTFVRRFMTNSDGRYSGKIKDKPGKYFANSDPFNFDDNDLCLQAQSGIAKHKH